MGEVEDIERPWPDWSRGAPPAPGKELARQRAEAVMRARREGGSHRAIARATGVSQAGVRRIIEWLGDSWPLRVRAANGKLYSSQPIRNGDGLGGSASRYRIVGASEERRGAVAAGVGGAVTAGALAARTRLLAARW